MKKTFLSTLTVIAILVVLSCKKEKTCHVPAGHFTCSNWFDECSKSEYAFFEDTCVKAGGVLKK
jgi:hypothetical protein